MAYIRKIERKKGTVYKVEVNYPDYSKIAKSFPTKQEAMIWGRAQDDLKRAHRSGGSARVRMTVDQYFERFMEEYASIHHSKGWRKSDLQMYRDYVQPEIGHLMIGEVQTAHIRGLLTRVIKMGRKHSMANRVRVLISKMFNEALKTDMFIPFNPVTSVKAFKEDPTPEEWFTMDEAKKLIQWADHHPLGLGIHLALNFGLRQGEISGLKWDSVDMSNKLLKITRKWNKRTNELDEFPKGKKHRTLPLFNPDVLSRLKVQREKYPNSDWVICLDDGSITKPHKLVAVYEQAIRETGVRRLTFHKQRHTFATLYRESGGDLYDLKDMMGHSDMKTTERYRHYDPRSIERRGNVLNLYSVQTPPTPSLKVVGGTDIENVSD